MSIFNINIRNNNCFLLHNWFPMMFVFTYNIQKQTSNTKYLELIKRTLKDQEKNMSCERALNFDQ